MAIYTASITTAAKAETDTVMQVEGHAITHVSVLFPSGCLGLVGVSVFYGIKKIFPHEENQDLRGNGETVQWGEYWQLPESPCNLTVHVQNEDDTYEHTVYIRLIVSKKQEMLATQLANAMLSALKRIFGFVST